MAVEAFIPDSVTINSEPVGEPVLITLYDPDGEAPAGSMTLKAPPPAGSVVSLAFEGTRDGKLWAVKMDRVEITNSSAVGCEFRVFGPPERRILKELDADDSPHEKGFEEQLKIR